MLKSVKADHEKFKEVTFKRGFNIVLADKSADSSSHDKDKDTRNGVGKTTLIDIIHFCLGSNVEKDSIFKKPELKDWNFTLNLDISGHSYNLERGFASKNQIYVDIDSDEKNDQYIPWKYKTDRRVKREYVKLGDFKDTLLEHFYGFKPSDSRHHMLSFRSLISYNIRRATGGMSDVFHFREAQDNNDRQICNSYLLGLNLDTVIDQCLLSNEESKLKEYQTLTKSDYFKKWNGLDIDDKTAAKKLKEAETRVQELKKELDSFKIIDEYAEISNDANQITKTLQDLTNDISLRRRYISQYQDAINEELVQVSPSIIRDIYAEAGIFFGDKLTHSLDEVLKFHKTLIANRKTYLSAEIARLEDTIKKNEALLEEKSIERSKILNILSAEGALEEYTLLQQRYSDVNNDYNNLKEFIASKNRINEEEDRFKSKKLQYSRSLSADYKDHINYIRTIQQIFSDNWSSLYSTPGSLEILPAGEGKTGYIFDTKATGKESQGITNMRIFCYDMLLAELGSKRERFPDFWIHDSNLFDSVDERQKAAALQLAYEKSQMFGFQYICMLNSDSVPYSMFKPGFEEIFDDSVVLRISDDSEDGGLFGMRF